MIGRSSRLSRERFAEVFKKGTRREAELFRVILSPTPEGDYRASAVVSKKIAPKAVSRNRIRRRIYHALLHLNETKPLSGSIIVIAKPSLLRAPYALIERELRLALTREVGRRHITR